MRIKKMVHKSEIQSTETIDALRKELKENISIHLFMGDTALELMKTCFTIGLRDINNREMQIRTGVVLNSVNRDLERIRKILSPLFTMKPESEDHMKGDHSFELYRLFRHFAFMPTDELREFNDGCEKANQKSLQHG